MIIRRDWFPLTKTVFVRVKIIGNSRYLITLELLWRVSRRCGAGLTSCRGFAAGFLRQRSAHFCHTVQNRYSTHVFKGLGCAAVKIDRSYPAVEKTNLVHGRGIPF